MFRRLVVVLVVLAVAVPWSARPALAIAHGEDVADGDYRFAVLLTMTGLPAEGGGTRDSSCSGALLAPRWVITAGHCFRAADGRRVSRTVAERTTATIGRAALDGDAGHVVEVIGVHQADGTDVALAELASAVTDITPIRIGTAPPVVGEVLRLAGFGLVLDGDTTAPAASLQTGLFTVVADRGALIETDGRTPREDTSPCPHDSGGPYFRESGDGSAVLVAVVSTGPGCPHPGTDFSARTDTLGDWITDTMTTTPLERWWPTAAIAGGVLLLGVLLTLASALPRRRYRARRRR